MRTNQGSEFARHPSRYRHMSCTFGGSYQPLNGEYPATGSKREVASWACPNLRLVHQGIELKKA